MSVFFPVYWLPTRIFLLVMLWSPQECSDFSPIGHRCIMSTLVGSSHCCTHCIVQSHMVGVALYIHHLFVRSSIECKDAYHLQH